MTYNVKWKDLWRSLTKYMTITIVSTIVVILLIRFVKDGFHYEVVFRHLSPLGYAALFIGMWLFSAVFSGIVSLFFKLAYITIENGYINGRNYWGRKKRIPLDKIQSLDTFSDNGINAVVVNGGKFGKVFIYTQTERFEELIELLQSYLPSRGAV